MKNRGRNGGLVLLTAILGLLVTIGFSGQVMAGGDGTEPLVINVTDSEYGANPDDNTDDTDAIQKALNKAKNTSDIPNGLLVNLGGAGDGAYRISRPLQVYSNTTISCGTVKIIATNNEGAMVIAAHVDSAGNYCEGTSCTHGGYGRTHDITISGGTWERSITSAPGGTSIFSFRHAKNITIQGATCVNATDHFINLSGTYNALVQNVTFRDAQKCQNTSTTFGKSHTTADSYNKVEAIHLDNCHLDGESGQTIYPLDNTPAKQITVENCEFFNVPSGVGNHHLYEGHEGGDIVIRNNIFDNLRWYAVDASGFRNLTVEGNIVTNAGGLIDLEDTSGTVLVKNNQYDRGTKADVISEGIKVRSGSDVVIQDNTIKNAGKNGIIVEGASKAVISGTTIESPAGKGIAITTGSEGTLKNNIISSSGDHGIYVSYSQCNASNNTITNAGGHAFCIENTEEVGIIGNTITAPVRNGISVVSSQKPSVSGNTVSSSGNHGIYMSSVTDAVLSGNIVTNSSGYAMIIEGGTETVGSTANVENNKLTSAAGKYDLRLGGYAKCTLSGNVCGGKGISVASTASYTGTVPTSSASASTKKNNTITAKDVVMTTNLEAAQSFSLSASALGGAGLTYSGGNSGISVNASGKVTIAKGFVGEASVTIKSKATSAYNAASKKITITVNPTGVKLKSAKNSKSKKIAVKWKKSSGKVTGYQIQYAMNKAFTKSAKIVKVKGVKKTSKTISKLKKKKTYYVRIRTYKTVSGKTYYSDWSTSKKVKIKK